MSEGTPDSLIPYDEIVQDALRAVVGRVLGQIEGAGGLPGNHHFYITFKTRAPGVDIPRHLTDRYPDEMTIVIQNRYWDLRVSETGFEVGLSFNQVGSKLAIPFAAITAFHDPAVDFALHFSAQVDDQQPEAIAAAENDPVVKPAEDGSNVVSSTSLGKSSDFLASGLNKALRQLGGLLPGVRAERRARGLQERMARIEQRLIEMHNLALRTDHLSVGSSATYVGDNRVLLRMIAGQHMFVLYVHADDKLISPGVIVNGGYEPDLTSFFVGALRPDSHCLDVGANVGYFSCLMGKFCPAGQVIGLEPNPPVHATAVDNVLVNGLHANARIINAAASDKVGELTLFHRIGREGNTSMAAVGESFTSFLQEPPEQAFQVPATRVDDLRDQLGGRVDFLKVDVEGAEPLVLAGARETIATNPQLQIVMEWAPAQISGAGFDIGGFTRDLEAAGLTALVIGVNSLEPISYDDLVGLPYRPGILLRRAT